MFADIARIQAQLIDAGFEGHQRQFVVKVDVGNDRNIRHALPNFFQRYRSIVIGDGEPDNLAPGADHILDLCHGGADIRCIGLGH